MSDFTVITPTGDRPEAFEICKNYVQRQTLIPSQWIIVDDGVNPTDVSDIKVPIKYIRRQREKLEPKHTISVQMIEALKYVKTDRIIIVEDDDWYCKDYFEKMMGMFDLPNKPILIGQGQTIYYHVPLQKYFVHGNNEHASLCQTGFRTAFISNMYKICNRCSKNNYPYVDMKIWIIKGINKYLLLNAPPLCIGMKGLPGRMGACNGHRNTERFKQDHNFEYLHSFIGDDVKFYEKFVKTL